RVRVGAAHARGRGCRRRRRDRCGARRRGADALGGHRGRLPSAGRRSGRRAYDGPMSYDGATRIKFCGITNLDDADAAVEAGAWALGMILWPGSARRCKLAAAAAIAAAYRRRAELVGVFV